MPQAKGAKTSRGEDTRRRILERTRELLADAGPGGVTLDSISQAAGVAKSSILWHFGSKEDLYLAVLDEVMARFEAMAVAEHPPDAPPITRLRGFFLDFAALVRAYPGGSRILVGSLFNPELMARVGEKVAAMYRRFRRSLSAHLSQGGCAVDEHVAAGVLGLLEGVFLQWHIDPSLDMEASFNAVADVLEALEKNLGPNYS
ncbi:MAG: TetR/AcrR family transcriptional regulator [Deltaproteobacteria bacterium]|nr:TetR/AcrR family transcriptional regulator [Deltaproteobacteria bacterium]